MRTGEIGISFSLWSLLIQSGYSDQHYMELNPSLDVCSTAFSFFIAILNAPFN